MPADTARALGRREFGGSGVVEQQERTELGAARMVRKEAAHRKPVTDPVAFRTSVDCGDAFHR
jgi:hypothetical protein